MDMGAADRTQKAVVKPKSGAQQQRHGKARRCLQRRVHPSIRRSQPPEGFSSS